VWFLLWALHRRARVGPVCGREPAIGPRLITASGGVGGTPVGGVVPLLTDEVAQSPGFYVRGTSERTPTALWYWPVSFSPFQDPPLLTLQLETSAPKSSKDCELIVRIKCS